MSLLPILALPPRPVTPPAPEPSSDTPDAFRVTSSDVSSEPPRPPNFDCRWLAQPFAQQLPIKLEPMECTMKQPYHFSSTFYNTSGEVPRLMVRLLDRQKERDFAADVLKWLPADDINQLVVRVTGEDNATLYWTVLVQGDLCQVRLYPSRRRTPLSTFPRLELAQVNAKRS